jgi:ABC-type dipeptide/oligopeptide/nickel transport system ATPase subunit
MMEPNVSRASNAAGGEVRTTPYLRDAPDAGDDPVRLDVRDLEIRLRDSGADVVSEVTFSVRAGEVLGLVGESGSGKTTVALALLGHARRGLTIAKGEVRLEGIDLLRSHDLIIALVDAVG